jgi:site-specific recombinase XerD
VQAAQQTATGIDVSCICVHWLRHTTAIDLLHAGVEQTVIAL